MLILNVVVVLKTPSPFPQFPTAVKFAIRNKLINLIWLTGKTTKNNVTRITLFYTRKIHNKIPTPAPLSP
jgi:hypothetical protein